MPVLRCQRKLHALRPDNTSTDQAQGSSDYQRGFPRLRLPLQPSPPEQENAPHNPDIREQIDWAKFLTRHDMVWKRLPGNWPEAAWTGNGMLGAMLWREGDALRLQVFRGDVQTHRPMTRGHSGYTRARLQIGSFHIRPAGRLIACDLRLGCHDAELTGTIRTDKGAPGIRRLTHAEDMAIVTELESEAGREPVRVEWKPARAMPTRGGYSRSEAELPKVRKSYRSKYPTEVFKPNPDPVVKARDGVSVCIQDGQGQAATGGLHRQSLAEGQQRPRRRLLRPKGLFPDRPGQYQVRITGRLSRIGRPSAVCRSGPPSAGGP